METREYHIEFVNFRGEGIARSQIPGRKAVRVGNALAGETVLATEIAPEEGEKGASRHGRRPMAYLRRVLKPSHERVAPVCPHYRRCAMCQFACMAYDAQAARKCDQWTRILNKFVDTTHLTNGIRFKPAIYTSGYRNRCEGYIFGDVVGIMPRPEAQAVEMAEYGASRPIGLSTCEMNAKALNRFIARVQSHIADCGFAPGTRLSFEANDDVPESRFCAEEMSSSRIIVYASPEDANQARSAARRLLSEMAPFTASVILQVLPPRGSHVYPPAECIATTAWYAYDFDETGNDVLCALKGAWTPVNPRHAHMIRETLSELSQNSHFDHVCEIGCGCGTHTGVFAPKADRYTGIDASWPAIQSAQFNAKHAPDWRNVSFFTDTAGHYLDRRYYKGVRADAIVMHGNRLPYRAHEARLCMRFGAETVFIVGPTAYALAQECHHFVALGCRLTDIVLCDTLPMSYHMMGVARLDRG